MYTNQKKENSEKNKTATKDRIFGSGSVYFVERLNCWIGAYTVGKKPNGRPDVRTVRARSENEASKKLKKLIEEDPRLHLVCLDLSMRDAVDSAKKLRSRSSETYMILVADMAIPPTVYMRPSIGAESLLLRPLDFAQIREVLSEAIGTYAKRFLNADDRKVFVLERKSFRELIEYDRICYFESREKKLFCNTGFEEYSFYGTLDLLQEQLGDAFIRCHRSFLVNKKKVVRVFLSQNLLELEGNIELPLSRSCKPAIKEFLKI